MAGKYWLSAVLLSFALAASGSAFGADRPPDLSGRGAPGLGPANYGPSGPPLPADPEMEYPPGEPGLPLADASCGPPCGDACCPDCRPVCCRPCGPRWTVIADALFLNRSRDRGQSLLSDRRDADLFNSSDLAFDLATGPRVDLIRHGCGLDLEVAYFGIHNWRGDDEISASSLTQGVALLAVDDQIRLPVSSATFAEQSRLDSTEVNLRWSLGRWGTMLAGFRWVELAEQYRATGLSLVTGEELTSLVRTHNHLYGLQFGEETVLLGRCGPLRLTGFGKCGLFGNAARQANELSDPGGLGRLAAGDRTNRASILAEAGLIGSLYLGPHFALRAGYQVMWIEKVALAPAQIAATDFGSGSAAVDTAAGIFYHGANAGFEVTW
jgi:hypothetical protein